MKKMKNRKGFTLVELIVVIAILAILAAVAIPVYSNYIKKANEASDYTMLDSIKTAAAFVATDKGVKLATPVAPKINTITVETTGVTVDTDQDATFDATITSADILNYVGISSVTFKSNTSKAEWNGTSWTLTPAS